MNSEFFSHFNCMSFNSLKTIIKKVIKDKGLTLGFVAKKVEVSEKTLSDWLGKNTTMDVYDLKKICEAVDYNFFKHIDVNISDSIKISPDKRARITVSIEVDDDSNERRILETILDKQTVKKLLG